MNRPRRNCKFPSHLQNGQYQVEKYGKKNAKLTNIEKETVHTRRRTKLKSIQIQVKLQTISQSQKFIENRTISNKTKTLFRQKIFQKQGSTQQQISNRRKSFESLRSLSISRHEIDINKNVSIEFQLYEESENVHSLQCIGQKCKNCPWAFSEQTSLFS